MVNKPKVGDTFRVYKVNVGDSELNESDCYAGSIDGDFTILLSNSGLTYLRSNRLKQVGTIRIKSLK